MYIFRGRGQRCDWPLSLKDDWLVRELVSFTGRWLVSFTYWCFHGTVNGPFHWKVNGPFHWPVIGQFHWKGIGQFRGRKVICEFYREVIGQFHWKVIGQSMEWWLHRFIESVLFFILMGVPSRERYLGRGQPCEWPILLQGKQTAGDWKRGGGFVSAGNASEWWISFEEGKVCDWP